MIKHPIDRLQRRLVNEKKAKKTTNANSVRKQIKERLKDQETEDELRKYALNRISGIEE